jgi:hypothetical protein
MRRARARRRRATPALERKPGEVAAERAGDVVDAEVERAREAAVGRGRRHDAELRRGHDGEVAERDQGEAGEHERQQLGQRQPGPGGGHDEAAERHRAPAARAGEPPGRGTGGAHRPDEEHEPGDRRVERERRPLEPEVDVREHALEREEQRAAADRGGDQRGRAEHARGIAGETPNSRVRSGRIAWVE